MFAHLILAAALVAQCQGRCATRATYAPPYAAPAVYDLADSAGHHWQHRDPAYLSAWVAARNAALARPVTAAYHGGQHATLVHGPPGSGLRAGTRVRLVGLARPPVPNPSGQRWWNVVLDGAVPLREYAVSELWLSLVH